MCAKRREPLRKLDLPCILLSCSGLCLCRSVLCTPKQKYNTLRPTPPRTRCRVLVILYRTSSASSKPEHAPAATTGARADLGPYRTRTIHNTSLGHSSHTWAHTRPQRAVSVNSVPLLLLHRCVYLPTRWRPTPRGQPGPSRVTVALLPQTAAPMLQPPSCRALADGARWRWRR